MIRCGYATAFISGSEFNLTINKTTNEKKTGQKETAFTGSTI